MNSKGWSGREEDLGGWFSNTLDNSGVTLENDDMRDMTNTTRQKHLSNARNPGYL